MRGASLILGLLSTDLLFDEHKRRVDEKFFRKKYFYFFDVAAAFVLTNL